MRDPRLTKALELVEISQAVKSAYIKRAKTQALDPKTPVALRVKRAKGIERALESSEIVFDNEQEQVDERKLTSVELKKREEVAQAIERDNPDMDMSKKMAIATSVAKKINESTEMTGHVSFDRGSDAHYSNLKYHGDDGAGNHILTAKDSHGSHTLLALNKHDHEVLAYAHHNSAQSAIEHAKERVKEKHKHFNTAQLSGANRTYSQVGGKGHYFNFHGK